MKSSSQIKNTPVSAMEPVAGTMNAIRPGNRQSRLKAIQQRAKMDPVITPCLGPDDCAKILAYYICRLRCAQTITPHVTRRTFYRRLLDHHERQARLSHFSAIVQVDQSPIGFSHVGGSSS